jgi:hypothetical protein
MPKIEAAKIEELKKQHGEALHLLTVGDEQIAVLQPRRIVYAQFRELLLAGRADANETLVQNCAVMPARGSADLEAVFDRQPALVDTFANALVKLAGGGVPAEAKKP